MASSCINQIQGSQMGLVSSSRTVTEVPGPRSFKWGWPLSSSVGEVGNGGLREGGCAAGQSAQRADRMAVTVLSQSAAARAGDLSVWTCCLSPTRTHCSTWEKATGTETSDQISRRSRTWSPNETAQRHGDRVRRPTARGVGSGQPHAGQGQQGPRERLGLTSRTRGDPGATSEGPVPRREQGRLEPNQGEKPGGNSSSERGDGLVDQTDQTTQHGGQAVGVRGGWGGEQGLV